MTAYGAIVRGVLLAAGLLAAGSAAAATVAVPPGDGTLAAAVAAADPGSVLVLEPGIYRGALVVDRPLTVQGADGAVVEGTGEGSVITVEAADVTLRGLTVRGSGADLQKMDSGVFVSRTAARAIVEDNRLVDNLFGVYLHGAGDSVVRGNTITGRTGLRAADAGNGVSIWNAPGAQVVDNVIRHGRDGIFVTTSRHNLFQGNRLEEVRFGVHYMYTNDSRVVGNTVLGSDAAFAIMFSNRIEIRDNVADGARDHGLLLNAANGSTVVGNVVRDSAGKCVFIYNANKNVIAANRFEGCGIGVHFTAGSERNAISGNAFIGNRTQVKYVGTRSLDWAHEGRGNYWSDNPAFDLDGDGIADQPYRPNDVVDVVVWTAPLAKLLLNSPAVQVIRWAQSQFPALHPGGVVDTAPLMAPPAGNGS